MSNQRDDFRNILLLAERSAKVVIMIFIQTIKAKSAEGAIYSEIGFKLKSKPRQYSDFKNTRLRPQLCRRNLVVFDIKIRFRVRPPTTVLSAHFFVAVIKTCAVATIKPFCGM